MKNLGGLVAGICSIVALVPQFIMITRTRRADDISAVAFIILGTGAALWVVYGFLVQSLPVVATNSGMLVFACTILILKRDFRSRS